MQSNSFNTMASSTSSSNDGHGHSIDAQSTSPSLPSSLKRPLRRRRLWSLTAISGIVVVSIVTMSVLSFTATMASTFHEQQPRNQRRTRVMQSQSDDSIENEDNDTVEDTQKETLKNVYTNGGCLYQKSITSNKRICSSEDPQEFIDKGYCIPQSSLNFDYMEIRIFSQNWESVFFETWILQIVLSELLHVPTTVETGIKGVNVDFYNPDSRFEYGLGDDWSCLIEGAKVGDCRNINQQEQQSSTTNNNNNNDNSTENDGSDDSYKSCCHFVPENWNGFTQEVKYHESIGTIEPVTGMGTIGEEHWFIPKFTAERDPSLLSYVGLAGEQNREKLANRFLRPTTWYDYCTQVSSSNCTIPDNVAQRPPKSPKSSSSTLSMFDNTTIIDGDTIDETNHFYMEGLYTGYFRKTDKNDCTGGIKNSTCSGHIIDYPCGWTSFVIQQAYHLGIALESDGNNQGGSGGYNYGEMVEIVKAANETKSDIVVMWWTPEALYQQFLGTDMEFTKITLTPVTQDCVDNRVTDEQRCSDDLETRVGDPLGSCGEAPQPLLKITGGWLYDATFGDHTPVALQSPAYDVLRAFRISGAEVGEMFDYWMDGNRDNPREAICRWAVDNMSTLQNFIPRDFPRVLRDESYSMREPLPLVAIIFATIATACVALATFFTWMQRRRRVMQHSQVEFLFILLAGLLLVSFGSLLSSIPPTNEICIATVWMTNVGYSLELTPLIVKMAAFYRLMHAARRMKHVRLHQKSLFGAVFLLTLIIVVYLVLWTVLDAPLKEAEYGLSDEKTDADETIITMAYFCNSKSDGWRYASVGWHMALLITATVQAVQTRSLRKEVNESQTLAIMIYSHFVFVLLRLVTLFLEDTLRGTDTMYVRSLIYSLDAIATINIYFVPKFFSSDDNGEQSEFFVESSTVRQLQMLAAVATNQHERQLSMQTNHDGSNRGSTRESGAQGSQSKSLSLDGTQKKKLKRLNDEIRFEIEETTNRYGDDPLIFENGDHRWCCKACNSNEMICAKCGETVGLLRNGEEETALLSKDNDDSDNN